MRNAICAVIFTLVCLSSGSAFADGHVPTDKEIHPAIKELFGTGYALMECQAEWLNHDGYYIKRLNYYGYFNRKNKKICDETVQAWEWEWVTTDGEVPLQQMHPKIRELRARVGRHLIWVSSLFLHAFHSNVQHPLLRAVMYENAVGGIEDTVRIIARYKKVIGYPFTRPDLLESIQGNLYIIGEYARRRGH